MLQVQWPKWLPCFFPLISGLKMTRGSLVKEKILDHFGSFWINICLNSFMKLQSEYRERLEHCFQSTSTQSGILTEFMELLEH